MSFLTFALQGMSTALGVMGALEQGESDALAAIIRGEGQARQFDAQADADLFNSKVALQLAESERERATAQAIDFRRSEGSKAASRRARVAAGNLAMEGSPLMVDESIWQEIEFGTQRISYAGQLASTRLTNEAKLLQESARNNRESARFSRQAGEISASNIRRASKINAVGAGIKGLTGFADTLSTRGADWGTGKKSSTKEWVPSTDWANW